MENNLKFSSIFSTIQGEGINAGKCTTFIRFHTKNCFPNGNFCSFCDTIYKDNYNENLNIGDIREFLMNERPNMITITGGEPFSVDIEKLIDFLTICKIYSNYIEVETNGSYFDLLTDSEKFAIIHLIDQFNISPKLKNSNVDHDYILSSFSFFKKKSIFKFVVNEKEFDDTIEEIKLWDEKISFKNRVWLMPQTPSNKKFEQKLFDFCVKNKYNYSPRIHIDLFGNIEKEI